MEHILQIMIGIGLAATCGFRIFVPLLIMGIAGSSGYLNLGSGFNWIASYPALIIFGIATVLELVAYFFPLIDNLLNAISAPAAVLAGIIVTAAVITDMNPVLQWTLAVVAGGGAASATSIISNSTHGASTVVSAGVANPVVSAGESVVSVILPIIAIALPVLAFVMIVLMVIWVFKTLGKLKGKITWPGWSASSRS